MLFNQCFVTKKPLVSLLAFFPLTLTALAAEKSEFAGKNRVSRDDMAKVEIYDGSWWDWRTQHGLPAGKVECRYNPKRGVSECLMDERDFDLLNDRLRHLERAVRQLQSVVFDVDSPVVSPDASKIKFACSVTSSFSKTYIGKGTTEVEARARALQSCEQAESPTFCSKGKPVCESEKR
jgi:hypothetical protein